MKLTRLPPERPYGIFLRWGDSWSSQVLLREYDSIQAWCDVPVKHFMAQLSVTFFLYMQAGTCSALVCGVVRGPCQAVV